MENTVGALYLDLLKKCLTREIFDERFRSIPRNTKTISRAIRTFVNDVLQKFLRVWHLALVDTQGPMGETMIGMGAMDNLQNCIEDVLQRNVPGDLCEAGAWRGGACIFMRATLKVHDDKNRIVWVADSFRGLPKPNDVLYPVDRGSNFWKLSLDVSLEEVKNNFKKYNLLDDQVKFVEGFFSKTLPSVSMKSLALLRIDADMYGSTYDALQYLYPKLSPGGYVIIDDFGLVSECSKAVNDFRIHQTVIEELKIIGYANGNPCGAYWKKSDHPR